MQKIVTIVFCLALFFNVLKTQTYEEFSSLSLEELLNYKIITASGIEEKYLNSPASIIIITSEDIKLRGYSSLEEVLNDIPGFDVVVSNGSSYLNAYQRGYRTPYTQRTLFMINGQVDNHLWTHDAIITRQYPMSGIDRIEILFGPASAIYGPNAFLGIINIVTKDATKFKNGKFKTDVNFQIGSFNSRNVDISTTGKINDVSLFLSGRIFKSDEPDLSGKWGFLTNEQLGDRKIWGPMLDIDYAGKKLGTYYDPTDDYGFIGTLKYDGYTFGIINGMKREGYGAHFASDRAQINSYWNSYSLQFYLEKKSEITDKIKTSTLALYRQSRLFGEWIEAVPDWDNSVVEDFEKYSWVSFTNWSTYNYSWLFKQNVEYSLSKNLILTGGVKVEKKELTKAYDIPGYWNAYSSVFIEDNGKYGHGLAVTHSSEDKYFLAPAPANFMPKDNITITEDYGGFIQAIYDFEKYRFNLGVRYDRNSMYGSSINPRFSLMYRFAKNSAFKIFYGEAFQEPAPIVLFGGWNGRLANPDLKPEKARNFELILMFQTGNLFHDISMYSAYYQNVIKEEAENAGERDIFGVEYRLKFHIKNIIKNSADISGYLNYSYTNVISSIYYDHTKNEWIEGRTDLGDIAPHKINFGINFPVKNSLNINLRLNFVSRRLVYSRNALRAKDYKIDAYFLLHGSCTYKIKPFSITVKVLNILNAEYFHPGIEGAGAGDDFENRSLAFQNSIIPQPGRSVWVNLGIEM